MKNSSSKKKRVVGMILAFLMVFNLLVFTGQVGAFAGEPTQDNPSVLAPDNTSGLNQSTSDESAQNNSGESTQNTSDESNQNNSTQNNSGESASDGSITVKVLTNFQEIKGIDQLESYRESVKKSTTEGNVTEKTAKVAMIPEKYGTSDVIMGLPAGSALVELNGLVSESSSSVYNTSTVVTDTTKIEYLTVPESGRGKGFDHCPGGSIVYLSKGTKVTRNSNDTTTNGEYTLTEDAWFYNCSGGFVKNAGPFYIYTYVEDELTYTADNVEIEFKEGFIPLITAGTVDPSSLEAVIKVGGNTYTVPSIELTDNNTVDPNKDDYTVTVKVGVGESCITKDVKAAIKLEESAVFARLKSGKYTGVQAKTFSKDDIAVGFTLDGESYTASDFELVDPYVDPSKGDTKITIKYAGYTKKIEAAKAITGDVKANGTTDVKELITKVSTITPKAQSVINNNSISTVEAAINIMEPTKLDKYVNEAIDLGDANVAVKQDGTAAKLQAKVNTVDASVITNSLTPEEIIRVLAGEKVDLRLEVVVDETTDAKETTGGQLIESNLNTNESAYYFTADLYKIFNNDEDNKSSITEFSDAISFTIDIPEEIRNEGRVFTLVASHELADGTFETFELVDTDDDDATFTASTTKLCTMALVYADEAVAETPIVEDPVIEPANNYDVSPETADLRNILWAFIITVSAGAVLVVTFRKEFQ